MLFAGRTSATENSTQKLQSKIRARKAAEAAIQLLTESADGDLEHYWKIIRDEVCKKTKPPKDELQPMPDGWADAFELEVIEFGKYKGYAIADVPLDYLDWLAGMGDEFKNRVRQYLANPKVAQRLQDRLENLDADVAAD